MLAAADEAPALNRGARRRACANVSGRQCSGRGDSQDVRQHLRRELRLVCGYRGSLHRVAACPVVVIPDSADTIASIKKVLTACPKPGERPSIHAPHLSKADTPKISPTDEKVW